MLRIIHRRNIPFDVNVRVMSTDVNVRDAINVATCKHIGV